jgi:ribonuclease VapC
MVIDSSAIVAIMLGEIDAVPFAHAIEQDRVRLVSTVSALEINLVMGSRKGPAAIREIDLFLLRAAVEIVAFNGDQFELARAAWLKFGKGRHPAALNLGDCCSYALARMSGEPLLAKGNDFVRTDIRMASVSSGPSSTSKPARRPPN